MRVILTGAFAALLVGGSSVPAQADCTCRARGAVAAHGQTLCITTPEGLRLARCEKVSNVASWRFLKGSCTLAGASSPQRTADAEPGRPADKYLR